MKKPKGNNKSESEAKRLNPAERLALELGSKRSLKIVNALRKIARDDTISLSEAKKISSRELNALMNGLMQNSKTKEKTLRLKHERPILIVKGEKHQLCVDALSEVARDDTNSLSNAKQIAQSVLVKTYGLKYPDEVREENKKYKLIMSEYEKQQSSNTGALFLKGVGETRKPGSHTNQI